MFQYIDKNMTLRSLIMVAVDCLLIFCAVFALTLLWYRFDMQLFVSYDPYLLKTSWVAAANIFSMAYFELYTPSSYRLDLQIFRKIVQSIFLASGILFVSYYFYPPLKIDTAVWLGTFIVFPFVLMLWRWFYARYLSSEFSRERILIMGSGALATKVARGILAYKDLGMDVVGFLDKDDSRLGYSIVNPRIIGTYDGLAEIVAQQKVDTIIMALPDRRGRFSMDTVLECKLKGVHIEDGESTFERIMGRIPVDQLKPSWMVFGEGFYLLKIERILKRIFDVIVAVFGLVIWSPIIALVALLIRLDSKGPAFFKQTRIGENGKLFTLVKFRTMRLLDPTKEAEEWAQDDDARITRVGKILRKTRIDEIPQLLNVLKGDMSVVGPRPDMLFLRDQMENEVPYYSLRYSVKPGVTGWAQIKYRYVASIEEGTERHEYDLYYIKNFSILFDAWIMLKTIQVMVAKVGAR